MQMFSVKHRSLMQKPESNSDTPDVPYKRLSWFYALYFALLGGIVPYWSLYLKDEGFSSEHIGYLLAAFSAVRIIAPNLWVYISSHLPQSVLTLRIAAILMLLFFSGIFIISGDGGMTFRDVAVVMVAFGFFWAALLPQYETITLQYLRDDIDVYSRIRLWGSVGFILMVLVLGGLFDFISFRWLPVIIFITMSAIVINSFLHGIPGRTEISEESQGERVHWKFPLLAFLAATLLLQISFGPYYVFFSIFLESAGYSAGMIGFLWSLGVIAEIVAFRKIHILTVRFSLAALMVISLLLTSVRWLVTVWFSDEVFIMILAQCLHAFSFGVLHSVSVKYVTSFFPGRYRSHGQALYSGLGFGLGGTIGAFLAGVYWESEGAIAVFSGAAMIAALAAVFALIGLRKSQLQA